MKSLFFLCLSFLALNVNATIRRVNNTPGMLGNPVCSTCYSSLQTAIDAAFPNDTIHVEGSATNYGTITISKPLVVLGTGYLLASNPGIQQSTQNSLITKITIYEGAGSGNGLKLSGLELTGGSSPLVFDILQSGNTLSNVTVERCRIPNDRIYFDTGSFQNITIRNCWFRGLVMPSNATITASVFHNNVVFGSSAYFEISSTSSVMVYQNVISLLSSGYDVDIYNGTTFFNNAVFFSGAGTFNVNNNSCSNVYNNIFEISLPFLEACGGGNNHFGIAEGSVFVSGTANFSEESDTFVYPPQACAICHSGYVAGGGSANDTEEIGIHGGLVPYVIAGIPDIPTISSLAGSPQTYEGGTITIEVTSKANN